jgi:hypothetical protein
MIEATIVCRLRSAVSLATNRRSILIVVMGSVSR